MNLLCWMFMRAPLCYVYIIIITRKCIYAVNLRQPSVERATYKRIWGGYD